MAAGFVSGWVPLEVSEGLWLLSVSFLTSTMFLSGWVPLDWSGLDESLGV